MFSVPGISYPLHASGVVLRGVDPSRFLFECAPQQFVSSPYGSINAVRDGGSFQVTEAALESYHLRHRRERGGAAILAANYVDRRWKWKSLGVFSSLNSRLLDNSVRWSAVAPWRRSARELFAAIFAGLGEVADVADAPGNVYPPFEFQGETARDVLEYLCSYCSCTIVLTSNNTFKVCRLGVGAPLVPTAFKSHINCVVDIGTIPSAVGIACSPTVFQSRLLLEAVGLDTDGKIKLLNALSYKPAGGWSAESPIQFPNVSQASRHLAFQTVWRWFRVKSQAGGGLTIPGTKYQVDSPIQYRLLQHLAVPGSNYDTPCLLPPRVFGKHYPKTDHPRNTPEKASLTAPFKIIPEMGIVEFDYPQWTQGTGQSTSGYYEPTLYLETAYNLMQSDGSGYVTYFPTLDVLPATFTQAMPLPHPELWESHVVNYAQNGTKVIGFTNNAVALGVECNEYLVRARDAFLGLRQSTDMEFASLGNVDLDGVRSQATFETGESCPPLTRIGQGTEVDPFTKQPRHRRRVE